MPTECEDSRLARGASPSPSRIAHRQPVGMAENQPQLEKASGKGLMKYEPYVQQLTADGYRKTMTFAVSFSFSRTPGARRTFHISSTSICHASLSCGL